MPNLQEQRRPRLGGPLAQACAARLVAEVLQTFIGVASHPTFEIASAESGQHSMECSYLPLLKHARERYKAD